MNRATYNITNDRIKVWFAERLPDAEWQEAKRAGFVYWFGSKCLTCVWRPSAEDFITARGIEIEEDDTPDNAEARADRFAGYAEDAEKNAESRTDYLHTRANTERRQRLALNGAMNETQRAAYWQRRIEATISHARFKDRPDVIARRIDVLETEARRHTASFTPHTDKAGNVIRYGSQVIVGPKGGRGSHAVEESRLPELEAWGRRWLSHIEDRLIYERAQLAAAGGIQADIAAPGGGAAVFEVGGAVKAPRWCRGGWLEVLKVNKKTVSIYDPHCDWCHFRNLDFTEITETASKLRVDSGEIALPTRAPKVAKEKATTAQTRAGLTPQKFGAVGVDSSYGGKAEDATWCLIVRVNRQTVEIVHKDISQGRAQWLTKKQDIRPIRFLLTPDEVKTQRPELLADFAQLQKLRETRAAAKAATAATQPEAAA